MNPTTSLTHAFSPPQRRRATAVVLRQLAGIYGLAGYDELMAQPSTRRPTPSTQAIPSAQKMNTGSNASRMDSCLTESVRRSRHQVVQISER
jgi:hypothetical protein